MPRECIEHLGCVCTGVVGPTQAVLWRHNVVEGRKVGLGKVDDEGVKGVAVERDVRRREERRRSATAKVEQELEHLGVTVRE